MMRRARNLYLRLDECYPAPMRVCRYCVSGGISFSTNFILLYLFTDIFGAWYLASAIAAFLVAFVVSFVTQKFWTFGDHSRNGLHTQVGGYLTIMLVNLALNTLLVYMLVEQTGLHYLIAQTLASLLIAFESFFVYQHVIFRKNAA